MASNIEGTPQMIKHGFQSCRPRMRFMKPPKAFHFRIPEPEPEPEECDLMDKDELYASEIKPSSPCEASSSTEGSCALHSVCGSCSTPSLDDDEGESHELDEINSPQSDDSGPSISSPSYFDCNLCLRMARKPAKNSCGHLFCAICFQNWLPIFSLAHPECPCKSDMSPSLLHHSDSAACLYLLRETSRPRRPQFWLQSTTTKSKEWTLFMKFQLM